MHDISRNASMHSVTGIIKEGTHAQAKTQGTGILLI